MNDDNLQPADRTVVEFNYDSHPTMAILRLDQPDDEYWWGCVYDIAIEDEWWYGHPDEPTLGDAGNKDGADDQKIRDWCRRNIEPPNWVWHRFVALPEEEQDDENAYTLNSSPTPLDGYWRGAIIELADRPSGGSDA